MNIVNFSIGLLTHNKKFIKYFKKEIKEDWVKDSMKEKPFQTIVGLYVLMMYESFGIPFEDTTKLIFDAME